MANTLIAEDWKKIYQTFKDANFQSYDFETLRKSMIDYLRLYYPEDFNDFIESSEYVALVDLIAFLGQSLAFRADLNARENFLDTAERRDSILKLARLINYTPKRVIPASGMLKIESVSTTETKIDSTGINITDIPIYWNDFANDNWLEQMSLVINSALIDSQMIGKSGNSQLINGIRTDEYSINLREVMLPVFAFSANIGGTRMTFEAVSASTVGQSSIYEVPPTPTNKFNILYRNDNNGNSSNNTGFFIFFKQGELNTTPFTLKEALTNRVVSINSANINNDDVWVYQLTANTLAPIQWEKVPAVSGINIAYNESVERNLCQIVTRANDQIDIVFGDGSFSNVPQGSFAAYYRTSANLDYKVVPAEMQNVRINIDYVSRLGRIETLTLTASLQYTVSNATQREDIESIRQRAPQMYYTQNRMITGEDYNLFPYANYSNVLKVKAANRTSSGISRFLDVTDVTGKYSSTSIFADDGRLYKHQFVKMFTFTFNDFIDVYKTIYSNLISIMQSKEMLHFYYDLYKDYRDLLTPNELYYTTPNTTWNMSSLLTTGATGYFGDDTNDVIAVGYTTSTKARYIRVGTIVKFKAPDGYHFNNHNDLVLGSPVYDSEKTYLYASVVQVIGDGSNAGNGELSNGSGPVSLNIKIPTGAIVDQLIPVLKNDLTTAEILTLITSYISEYKNFGLAYNPKLQVWEAIDPENLDLESKFDLSTYGNITNNNLDSSWAIAFKYTGSEYIVYYRGTDFIFESYNQVKFYFDKKIKVFDSKSGRTIVDQINILNINNKPDSTSALETNLVWYVHNSIVESDGHELTNKILLTYPDTNSDNIPDNPDVFDTLINPTNNPTKKLVFSQIVGSVTTFSGELPIRSSDVIVQYNSKLEIEQSMFLYNIGQLFYVLVEDKFYKLEVLNNIRTVTLVTGYVAYVGRDNISFQYKHNSPSYRRIDPSPNNLIDMYILTKTYNTEYKKWIQDTTSILTEPVAPTSDDLEIEFASLHTHKPVSDALILSSAKFKPLFGEKAHPSLQATFKVVKNQNVVISDNEVKSKLITAVNTYFSTELREFGESFFFSDLSAYLHAELAPMISSVMLVPKATNGIFGSLYQINSSPDEIFASAATVDDVEIISSITLAQLSQA